MRKISVRPFPLSCQLRLVHIPQSPDTTQRYIFTPSLNPPPSTYPPSKSSPAMGIIIRTSEDSLLSDKEDLDTGSLPLPSLAKTFGVKKRTLFATATLVSLLFLASYLTLQTRASDWFGNDLEPIPFQPEVVEEDEFPSNETSSLELSYSYMGVRGPPTPLFRGVSSLAAPMNTSGSHRIPDNLLPDKQYLTSWPSAGWSESLCFSLVPFIVNHSVQRTM